MYVRMCRSERYLGMWSNDSYHGAGIQVAKNKFQFSGNFVRGERSVSKRKTKRFIANI